MRWISLKNLKQERYLAQHILDERGRVLLARGVQLTPSLVKRLWQLGIGSVCVEDEATSDIVPNEFVNSELRQHTLQATYQSLTELATGTFGKVVRPPRLKQRLKPLLMTVIDELKAIEGAGEHLGNVYLSDGELYHHSVNVTFFALSIGLGLNLSEDDLVDLGLGTLLHDVGKLRIPEYVLKKPGRLTPDEFEQVKLHTYYGYELLRDVPDLSSRSTHIALEHHERVDGSGYPRGLRGDEIQLFGRITGPVDVYEALTANRIYRAGYLPHQAYELLLGGGGTQFDPLMVDTFIRMIAIYPVGSTVSLSTGFRAVVVQSPPRSTHRPIVRIIEDEDGRPVPNPWQVDLSRELTVEITGCEA